MGRGTKTKNWSRNRVRPKISKMSVNPPLSFFGRVGVKGMNIGILFCGLFEDAAGDYVGNSMHWTIYCLLLSQL